jgi:hypothetical protein
MLVLIYWLNYVDKNATILGSTPYFQKTFRIILQEYIYQEIKDFIKERFLKTLQILKSRFPCRASRQSRSMFGSDDGHRELMRVRNMSRRPSGRKPQRVHVQYLFEWPSGSKTQRVTVCKDVQTQK